MNAGEYDGRAETLSKAKNTAVQALEHAGLVVSKAGKVRLVKREELSSNWHPKTSRLTVWEVMQRMIHELLDGKGDTGAGDILRQASAQGEVARDLAYRLYTVCERKGWSQEAQAYNSLVTSWLEISRLAHRQADSVQQATFSL
jgi:putative DNA methylase